MENQTAWIKSKMTTALSEDATSKLTEFVKGLPKETNVNNVSKLLVYLIETEPVAAAEVNPVNIKETEVYLELETRFTALKTSYNELVAQPPVNVEETEVYQSLLNRFTTLENQYQETVETLEKIEETEVYQKLKNRFTKLETSYNELANKPPVNVKETKVYQNLETKFTALEAAYNKLLEGTATENKDTTFYWEG